MGNAIEDQQVSCLWQGDYMLSVSVSGNINYLDKNNPNQPMRVLKVSTIFASISCQMSRSPTLIVGPQQEHHCCRVLFRC
jgi:hypothetical protein